VRTRTSLRAERAEARVRLLDERLWDFPYLHVTGHGEIRLDDAEVVRLREYLLRGGFLHADDNYGLDASFRREMARVFPDRPLVEVPLSHPIYHAVYSFPRGLRRSRARRQAAARLRHLRGRSARGVLHARVRPRERVGGRGHLPG
jgi:hypothetical protein